MPSLLSKFVLISSFLIISSHLECHESFGENNGTTYDLSPLELAIGSQLSYYTVRDERLTDKSENFTYHFNICNNVLKQPPHTSGCANAQYCTSSTDCPGDNDDNLADIFTDSNTLAYVYQRRPDDAPPQQCFVLSTAESDAHESVDWQLYDNNNPARGVTLRYLNGQWCNAGQKNREFLINFICKDDSYNIPDEETLVEMPTCVYQLTLDSIYGCPNQCGTYQNRLCSGSGICDYDFSNNASKCFCYDTRQGVACENQVKSTFSRSEDTTYSGDYVFTFTEDFKVSTVDGEINNEIDVTYDLAAWQESGKFWYVNDTDTKYYYLWTLGGYVPTNTQELPESCASATKNCESDCDADSLSDLATNKQGSVWQIDEEDGTCYLISTDVSDFTHNLYDVEYPAAGMTLTLKNGGYCYVENSDGDVIVNKNRQISINFLCPDTTRTFTEPDEAKNNVIKTYVEEGEGTEGKCTYSFDIESALACPSQCISASSNGNYEVCSGRGICAADYYASTVRCLCDTGYAGSLCEKTSKTVTSGGNGDSHTGFQVAISIIVIIAIVLIGVTLYLYMQNKSLKDKFGKHLIPDGDEDEQINVINSHLYESNKGPTEPVLDSSGEDDNDSRHNSNEDDDNNNNNDIQDTQQIPQTTQGGGNNNVELQDIQIEAPKEDDETDTLIS